LIHQTLILSIYPVLERIPDPPEYEPKNSSELRIVEYPSRSIFSTGSVALSHNSRICFSISAFCVTVRGGHWVFYAEAKMLNIRTKIDRWFFILQRIFSFVNQSYYWKQAKSKLF